jgi:thymidylate synthase (FAD)
MKAEFISTTSNDLTAVNSARVSMDKESTSFTYRKDQPKGSDEGLLEYLASHAHWTTYSHQRVTFIDCRWLDLSILDELDLAGMVYTKQVNGELKVRTSLWGWTSLIKKGNVNPLFVDSLVHTLRRLYPESTRAILGDAVSPLVDKSVSQPLDPVETDPRFMDITMRETVPLFVARQRFKHMISHTYNEVSRRYVQGAVELFMPETWRMIPDGSIKQGSGGDHPYQSAINAQVSKYHEAALEHYESLLKQKVAPEQARMELPQSMYTSYYVTANLTGWARAYKQRIDLTAQGEIQDLAKDWDSVISELYPEQWKMLTQDAPEAA